jgi:putative hydrolase
MARKITHASKINQKKDYGVTRLKIEADLHVHTIASGHAYSTIDEISREAAKKGLSMIAMTDHGPNLPGGAHPYHFWNLRVIPRELNGVRVLRGVEANIMNSDAELDLPEDYLELLEIVLAGFHPVCGYESGSAVQNTNVLIKAMENKFVDVIVHPGNARFPIEPKPLVEASKALGVALEINNSSFLATSNRLSAYDFDIQIAKHVAELGSPVAISSDAHIYLQVGELSKAIDLAEEAGITSNQVINASAERVLDYLENRRKVRKQ